MRVKRGVTSHAKHKKIFQANKGYRMTKRRLIRVAKEAYLHAGEYAFAGRRNKKRDNRQSWIVRISEAVKLQGINYSTFIKALKTQKIELDRKIMAILVLDHPDVFQALVEKAKSAK
jgi:large subunit ribosomal protein L20